MVVNKRTPASGPHTHSSSPSTSNTGVYITFSKKDDAARAIEAVDGTNYEGKIKDTYITRQNYKSDVWHYEILLVLP